MTEKIIVTNRTEYDQVISLGGACATAMQLTHRGRRFGAFPLDWTLMLDETPVKKLPKLIRTEFRDFCKQENLVESGAPMADKAGMKCRVTDTGTGFHLWHHFTPPLVENYGKSVETIRRRMARFYKTVERADNVLFVLATRFPFDAELITDIYKALKEKFPQTGIEIVNMQFAADKCEHQELEGGQVHLVRYERPMNMVYDNQLTAPEWSFMDQVEVVGHPLPEQYRRKQLKLKWVYKIWYALGKYLERNGAGCANMRFLKWLDY